MSDKKEIPYWDQKPENINEIACFIFMKHKVLSSQCNGKNKCSFLVSKLFPFLLIFIFMTMIEFNQNEAEFALIFFCSMLCFKGKNLSRLFPLTSCHRSQEQCFSLTSSNFCVGISMIKERKKKTFNQEST